MLTAVLLAAIGSADLWRSLFRGRVSARPTAGAPVGAGAVLPVSAARSLGAALSTWVGRSTGAALSSGVVLSIGVTWLLLATLAVTGLGVPLGWVVLCLVAAGAWLALTTSDEHSTGRAGRAAVGGLIVLVVVLLLTDRTALELSGYLVDGHRDAATAVIRGTPLTVLALFAGVGLFLVESANIVVRIALHTRADVPEMPEVPDLTGTDPTGTDPTRTDPTRTDLTRTDLTRTDLKGGRLIGPLERLLIVAIVLAGYAPIAAALVAAKGIVRFPEIAQDARGGDGLSGTKAEYFLVGSLVSWATAAGAVALLVAAR